MNAQATRWAPGAAIVTAAGWVLLASADGGIDVGERPGIGATVVALILLLAAIGAGIGLWCTREDAVWRSGPTRMALGGLGGLTLLAALSIGWAPQPHIAWIEANQAALYVATCIIAVTLTVRLRPSAERTALLIAAGAAVPVVAALLIEILPGLLGSDLDPGRLTQPAGYHNALALIAVAGVIGTASSGPRDRRTLALAGAAGTLFLTALALTLSRGGVIALIAGLALLFLLRGRRGVALGALLAGLVGASIPVAWGLSRSALTDERVPVALREDDALILGLCLLAGLTLAAGLSAALNGRTPRGPGIAVLAASALALSAAALPATVAGTAAAPESPGASAIDNRPGRAVSLAPNNRDAWWEEAVRGFRDAPLVGNGAGSFRMVHLRERRDDSSLFITRQPHQIVLKMLSDLGLAGLALLILWPAGLLWALARSGRASPAAPAAAVLAAFFCQAQFDWLFSLPSTGALAAACGGVVLGAAARGPLRAVPAEAIRAGGLAAIVGLVAVSAVLPWLALREVAAAERATSEGDTAAALGHAGRAAALNPLSSRPLEEESFAHFTAGDVAAAAAARRRLTEIQPENPFAWSGLATLLGGEAARDAWLRVIELDPNNRAARRALGRD